MVDHNKQAPELPPHATPWWMDGQTRSEQLKEPHYLANGVMTFWQRVRDWLLLPMTQRDPETCSEDMLYLLAWERDIDRFDDEPLGLFRKRVKFAFANAQDAGNYNGFSAIFARMGLEVLEQKERQPQCDWDVVTIELPEHTVTNDLQLLSQLVQHYGRTCRRYELAVSNQIVVGLTAVEFNCEWQCFRASMAVDYSVNDRVSLNRTPTEFNHQSQTFQACWE
ncbi:phage tail protein [Vibrio sp. 03-59-1]|uniref:phage tail protein n=1 Tax=Vibrio sp. 03-59-1 TaxID=2607607 RepID=UPI0014939FEE|nr:phage tail protein [Vibrio sp. 03-59-1]NOH82854.1 phage tail protein [Vibrio sp. 03-59-1]